MKSSDYPEPGTEAFTQLGPAARRLSRMVHNTQSITRNQGETRENTRTLNHYTEQEGRYLMSYYCEAESCTKFPKDGTGYCREHQEEDYRSEEV